MPLRQRHEIGIRLVLDSLFIVFRLLLLLGKQDVACSWIIPVASRTRLLHLIRLEHSLVFINNFWELLLAFYWCNKQETGITLCCCLTQPSITYHNINFFCNGFHPLDLPKGTGGQPTSAVNDDSVYQSSFQLWSNEEPGMGEQLKHSWGTLNPIIDIASGLGRRLEQQVFDCVFRVY